MTNVVPLRKSYVAKEFRASVEGQEILVSGTLCGHVNVAFPGRIYCLSVEEGRELAAAILSSCEDVVANSRPFDDPLLVDPW